MFVADGAQDAMGRPVQEAFKEELFKVADGLQTLAWLVSSMPEDEARRTLRAAAAGEDPRLVPIVDFFVGKV